MLGSMENYRLHSKKDEDEKNLVPKKHVVLGVLLQQLVQAVVATILFAVSGLLFILSFFRFLDLLCCYLFMHIYSEFAFYVSPPIEGH